MRNNKPLRIKVSSVLEGAKEFEELARKGHEVIYVDDDCDIHFGPKNWRMVPELVKLVPVAVTAARNVKYRRKAKEEENDDE